MSKQKHITGYDIREPDSATITVGSATDTVDIAIQLLDYAGNALKTKAAIRCYYTTDADGDTVEAVGAASVVATDGIVIEDLTTFTATLISEDDGTVGITIDGDGTATDYLCLIFPDGHVQISDAFTFTS